MVYDVVSKVIFERCKKEILKLKKELDVTIVAHFYQADEVFEMADITGDSLELAKKSINSKSDNIFFIVVL